MHNCACPCRHSAAHTGTQPGSQPANNLQPHNQPGSLPCPLAASEPPPPPPASNLPDLQRRQRRSPAHSNSLPDLRVLLPGRAAATAAAGAAEAPQPNGLLPASSAAAVKTWRPSRLANSCHGPGPAAGQLEPERLSGSGRPADPAVAAVAARPQNHAPAGRRASGVRFLVRGESLKQTSTEPELAGPGSVSSGRSLGGSLVIRTDDADSLNSFAGLSPGTRSPAVSSYGSSPTSSGHPAPTGGVSALSRAVAASAAR